MAFEGLSNIAGGFSLEPISGMTILIINVLILGLIGWGLYSIFSYNIKVHIRNHKGLLVRDSAKIVRDKDTKRIENLKLRKHKGWSGPLPKKFFIPSLGSFSRITQTVFFAEDKDGNLYPRYIPKNKKESAELDGMTQTDIASLQLEVKSALHSLRDQSFWSEYGALLLPFFGFVVVFVLGIVMFQQMAPIADGLNAAATTSREAINTAAQLYANNATQVIQ